ncbi:hypothetical protein DOE76_08795 [Leifsonia sp. ku-ls]|nr:hypothetical protein DOE76_08795 [Leifsonia sp. ku-ls]
MRRTTRLAIGIGVAGALAFGAGAGTSAGIALDATHRVESQFDKAKRKAVGLYDDDVKNRKQLAHVQDQVSGAHTAMVTMKKLVGDAPWLTSETRKALDGAIADLETYGQDSAPGEPLPKPPAEKRSASVFALSGQIDRLLEYTLDHEEDHAATERAVRHVTASLDTASSVLRDVVLQSILAGQPVPQS